MPRNFAGIYRTISGNTLFQFAVLYLALNTVFRFQFDVALILYISVLAVYCWPEKRIGIIATASTLTFLLFDFQFSYFPHYLPQMRDYHNAFYAWINKSGRYLTGFGRLEAILIRALVFVLIFGLVALCSRNRRIRAAFSSSWVWIIGYSALLFVLTREGGLSVNTPVVVVASVIALAHFVLILPFVLRNLGEARPSAGTLVANISPPWSRGFLRCWDDTFSSQSDGGHFAKLRASGARYLIHLSICYLGIVKLLEWLYPMSPSRGLVASLDVGLPGAAYLADSRAQLWFSAFLNQLALIGLLLTCTIGPYVAIARYFGVAASRPVYRPLGSVSFSDYMVRVYHYYNRFLVEEFFFPVYDRLRFLRGAYGVRKWLAILITVVIGGGTFHLIKDSFAILNQGHAAVLRMYAEGLLPYLLLLAIASSIPSAASARRSRVFRAAQLLAIIAAYTVFLVFTYGFKQSQESLASRINYLRHLFGL